MLFSVFLVTCFSLVYGGQSSLARLLSRSHLPVSCRGQLQKSSRGATYPQKSSPGHSSRLVCFPLLWFLTTQPFHLRRYFEVVFLVRFHIVESRRQQHDEKTREEGTRVGQQRDLFGRAQSLEARADYSFSENDAGTFGEGVSEPVVRQAYTFTMSQVIMKRLPEFVVKSEFEMRAL